MKIPKEIDTNEIVKKDTEKFMSLYRDMKRRLDGPEKIETFLYSWGLVEQFFLPSIIRLITHKLSLKMLPDLEKVSVSHLINYYYFISHDVDLYKNLVKGNNLRNKIVHKMCYIDKLELEKDLKDFSLFVQKEIIVPLLERTSGKVSIPVLTLYGNGWNDFRAEVIKIIKKYKF